MRVTCQDYGTDITSLLLHIITAFVLIMGRAHVQLTVALQLCGVSPAQGIALALSRQHPLQPLQLKMLRHSA